MPRNLSSTARSALYAPQTGEVLLHLLTLSHVSLPEPIRVTDNTEDVVSLGTTYQAFPFEATLPDETEEGVPQVTLSICNADRRIVQAVRSVQGDAMKAELRVVLAGSPDVTEAGPYMFDLRDIEYDAAVVSGRLRFEDLLNEPYPCDEFTPTRTPGVFGLGAAA